MTELTTFQKKLRLRVTTPWKFGLFLFTKLPMGLLAGLRLHHLDEQSCTTSVPCNFLTKNPFNSTYFAVLSMAAELSTGAHCLLATGGRRPSVALIIIDMQAKFLKKATDRVHFTCTEGQKAHDAVAISVANKTAQTTTLHTVGKMKDGTIVAEFAFTWSFKERTSQP